eukprot:gene2275-17888_t
MDERALYALAVSDGKTNQEYLLAYFEQLKNADEGLQLSSDALAKDAYSDEKVKFFLLQVLEHHVKVRYSQLKSDQIQIVKINCMEWLKKCCTSDQKLFIRKKTAQIFALFFVQEYPSKWLSFFKDVIALFGYGEKAAEMYFRILLAIDEEVVSRHIQSPSVEMERNTNIKDAMRVHCVPELVDSWYNLLKLYEGSNAELTCLCLQVIGAYISWIDIDLIANEKFVGTILRYLKDELRRESACECFFEIISKGMEPTAKTRLIESLTNALENVGVLSPNEGEDLDFVAKVAKLINGMGIQLITSWSKYPKVNGEVNGEMGQSAIILKAIERKIPYMLRFLSHEDDDISETVSEFAHSYLGLLKQMKVMQGPHIEYLRKLLFIVIKKMKFDDDYDFENEEEDEAMFQDFRKQMKVLLDNIGKLDGDLVVSTLHEYVQRTLQNADKVPLLDLELAVHLVYLLGEAIPGQDLFNDSQKFSKLQEMMISLITSKVSWAQHIAVKLQYFETVTRYERFFYAQTQYIPEALEAFLDERGLRNPSTKICSRTSYLLMRFTKVLKSQIQPYVDNILQRLQDLLVNSQDDSYKSKSQLNGDDLNYLYELAATLIICSGASPENMNAMMQCLLSPVILRFTKVLSMLDSLRNDELALLNSAQELHTLMGFTSRASKAFSSQLSLKASGCAECFKEALPIFLQSLTTPYHRDVIHAGVRQYLHRMIICLGDELLPYLPIAVTHLLKDCEVRDIQEFIPLINQLIARFKTQISPFLCEIFLPVVNTIFSILNSPIDEADMQAVKERQILRRSYYLFLCTIVNNGVVEVIVNCGADSIKTILYSVVQGAAEIPDPQGQKNCFVILGKFIDLFGDEMNWMGFKEFTYENILPACLVAPLKPVFDLNDGQCFLGQEVIQYLHASYLPQLQCPEEAAMDYCNTLQNMDAKHFKLYLKMFFEPVSDRRTWTDERQTLLEIRTTII